MSTYRAVEVTGSRQFAVVEREIRDPLPGQVRLRVEACGICHSDTLAVEGLRADPSVPVVPGHELVGVIDAVGAGVNTWTVGTRVGVGYLGGHCGECEPCRRGDFVNCANQPQTGTTVDGGYTEVAYARASGLARIPDGGYTEVAYARASGLARIPDGADPLDVAPLLCAGLTVYNALLKINARPGSLVAIQGIGGLGHLGLQYAKALGYRVAAIARGSDKAKLAAELGADDYLDSTSTDPGPALQRLGGAAAIIATASSGASMSPLLSGLAPRGQLIVLGAAPDPIEITTPNLIFGSRSVLGSLTGTSIDNEDNLRLAQQRGIRSHNEILPLSEAPKAYERMLSGHARFRVVLDTRQ